MALKFGDAVVLVKKSPEGKVTRVNAIVIAGVVQPPGVHGSKALKNHAGVLPEGEYLDLAYPVPELADSGLAPTTRDLDVLFRKTAATPPYVDGAWIGWETAESSSLPSAADLDAVAAEQEVAKATGSKVRQIKGK